MYIGLQGHITSTCVVLLYKVTVNTTLTGQTSGLLKKLIFKCYSRNQFALKLCLLYAPNINDLMCGFWMLILFVASLNPGSCVCWSCVSQTYQAAETAIQCNASFLDQRLYILNTLEYFKSHMQHRIQQK